MNPGSLFKTKMYLPVYYLDRGGVYAWHNAETLGMIVGETNFNIEYQYTVVLIDGELGLLWTENETIEVLESQ